MELETQKIWSLYRITNLINGKVYIGQAADVSKRWSDHRRAVKLNKPTQTIHHALIKYGLEHFAFDIIACCLTQEDANETETVLVSQYDSFVANGKGYNATHGGMNAPKSEEFKQTMRDHWADPNYKEQVSQSISQAYAEQTVEDKSEKSKLLSTILKGRHLNFDTEFQAGHKLSPESIQKISKTKTGKSNLTLKGVPKSQEHKNKISKAKMGHVPWNKGTKGLCKATSGGFKETISWPEDQELLTLANKNGLTFLGKRLGVSPSTISMRLKKKNLKLDKGSYLNHQTSEKN